MNISRQKLYAAGFPIGESETRKEAGRVIYGGGGGGSSSSSTATTTNTTDKRMVVDTGIGISSESSNVNVTTLDAGIVNKALEVVGANDATNGEGFDKLLNLADKLFTAGGALIENTSETTLAQVAALNTAQNDQKGSIDQKTMILLAAAGAATVYAISKKG